MLNKEIPKSDLEKVKMVVFDSDGVAIPRGTEISEVVTEKQVTVELKTLFISKEFAQNLKRLQEKFYVVISSGRSLLYLQTMYERALQKNIILQAENGSLSLIGTKIIQHLSINNEYTELISKIKDDIRQLPIKGIEPKQFILSVHSTEEVKDVYKVVEKHDTNNRLKVMWNGEAFDIQPKELSKAFGIRKLMDYFDLDKEEVLAIGDRINDIEMISSVGIGVSADKEAVDSQYHTIGDGLPGEILAEYLIDTLKL